MTTVTYIAKRSITAGHSADEEYTLAFDCSRLDPTRALRASEVRPIEGPAEVLLHAVDRGWSLTTEHLARAALAEWDEFLDSVAAGEPFTFDAYGTAGSPDSPRVAQLVNAREPQRLGHTEYFTLSFGVRFV